MNTYFSQMPGTARVWVYAADRFISAEEAEIMKEKAGAFIAGWTAHQVPVKAAFDVLYNRFCVFMVDVEDDQISGCGIDKSVHFMKTLGAECGMDFFNRSRVQVLLDERAESFTRQQIEQMFSDGKIVPDTLTFNNAVSTKAEFDSKWKIPLMDSWAFKTLKTIQA